MTHEEKHDLVEIVNGNPFQVRPFLKAYLEKVVPVESETVVKPISRTEQQNKALHLWFTQVSDECRRNSVDAKLVMSKVVRMDMTPLFIKEMWKTLQQALFGKKSTTELRKTGEIEQLYDHFVRFFANEFELELPPFPSDETKPINSGYKTGAKTSFEYPRNYEEPTI